MAPHSHNPRPDVNASPPNVHHYQARNPNRLPGLVVESSAIIDRNHMLEDGRHTTVFLRFTRMMDTYLPSLDGFDQVFTQEKIDAISTALRVACAPLAPDKKTVKAEKDVSTAWVSTYIRSICGALLNPYTNVPGGYERSAHALPRIHTESLRRPLRGHR